MDKTLYSNLSECLGNGFSKEEAKEICECTDKEVDQVYDYYDKINVSYRDN